MTPQRTIHIFYISRRVGPEEREAVSYCGDYEEMSGSGRHDMAHGPQGATCQACKSAFDTAWPDKLGGES